MRRLAAAAARRRGRARGRARAGVRAQSARASNPGVGVRPNDRRALVALACVAALRRRRRRCGAAPQAPPAARPHSRRRLATKAPLLAIARAGSRLVAVGDYGVILLSDDAGATWRQAKSVATRNDADGGDLRRRQARLGRRPRRHRAAHGGRRRDLDAPARRPATTSRCCRSGSRTPSHGIAVGAFGACDGDARRRPHVEEIDRRRRRRPRSPSQRRSSPSPAGRCSSPPRPAPCSARPTTARRWTTLRLPYDGSLWGGMALADGDRDRLRHARPRAAHRRPGPDAGPTCRPAPTSR